MTDPTRDPEEVLSQALRALAGGGRRTGTEPPGRSGGRSGSWWSGLTVAQVCLIALIVGVAAGTIAGIVVLLTR